MTKNKEAETTEAVPSEEKIDGQCSEPGCKSTRAPNGEKYICPVHVPKN